MKTFIIYLISLLVSTQLQAINHCEMPDSQEKFICVIAGGSANTNIALNEGHARSLALRTARILAYEKMAEKIKGIIIASQNKISNDQLSSAQINSMVKAKLQNINFEKESITYLHDGSPWAEVTISIPKIQKNTAEVLTYENGIATEIKETPSQEQLIIIDLRGQKFSRTLSPIIRTARTKALLFSSDMLPIGSKGVKYRTSLSSIIEDSNAKFHILKATVQGDTIYLNKNEVKLFKMLNYQSNVIEKQNLFFLTGETNE